ncbi:MBL fold metallo-hydrolase [Thermodesulfobacteriota bacterium]
MHEPKIVKPGAENGDGMIVHYQTMKGTDIFGMGVPNIYQGSDWDLGPTWCYLVLSKPVTLIDTGRRGNAQLLEELISHTGSDIDRIERIVITHSHEDHDGNLADILVRISPQLWVHPIYEKMISYSSSVNGKVRNPEFPISCWHCPMPPEFNQNCLAFQEARSQLHADVYIGEKDKHESESWKFYHTPGHSPDSICILLEGEIFFTGDHILPDITPHPSRASYFENCRDAIPPRFATENGLFGLHNYIKSLYKINNLPSAREWAVFPAHRLFFHNRFNLIQDIGGRANDIIEFHIQRCQDILKIINDGIHSASEIAVEYFEPSLLKGIGGKFLGENEILCHLEFMAECGDVVWEDLKSGVVKPEDTNNYEKKLLNYLAD